MHPRGAAEARTESVSLSVRKQRARFPLLLFSFFFFFNQGSHQDRQGRDVEGGKGGRDYFASSAVRLQSY